MPDILYIPSIEILNTKILQHFLGIKVNILGFCLGMVATKVYGYSCCINVISTFLLDSMSSSFVVKDVPFP